MQFQYNILYKSNVTLVKFHVNMRFFYKIPDFLWVKNDYSLLQHKWCKNHCISVQKFTLKALCMQYLSEMQFQYNILFKTNVTVVKFHVNMRFFTKYQIFCEWRMITACYSINDVKLTVYQCKRSHWRVYAYNFYLKCNFSTTFYTKPM